MARVADNPRWRAAPTGGNDGQMDERELLLRLAAPASGRVLAQAAGLTRAAVWKRVQALRAAGVAVTARPGHGYALAQPLDLLDAATIEGSLPLDAHAQLAALETAWSLDSTNSELLRRDPPLRGTAALLAERQTGGRGRRGRGWTSPLAANVYLSLSRRFSTGLARLGGLSLAAGVASAEALRALGIHAVRLKWPNDLLVDGRKLGGLLVEGSGEAAGAARAVVGVGVNVRMPAGFGAAIGQPWIDLRALGATASRNAVASELLAHLLPALDQFDRDGLAPFLPRYAAVDALRGSHITLHTGDGVHKGVALGVADDGALRVQVDGSERRFHAGEVSVRRA